MDPALIEIKERDDREVIEAIVKLKDPQRVPPGLEPVARFGDIATCRLARGQIDRIWSHKDVKSLKASRLLEFDAPGEPPDGLLEAAALRATDIRRPAQIVPTGKGVLIGIVDWGIDFAHPNLRRGDGSTRLEAIWDQRPMGGRQVPAPYGYGRLLTRADINQALARSDPYAGLGYFPADADPHDIGTHGTHVTDIAAGNGNLDGSPLGIAPGSDLVFVHLAAGHLGGLANLGDSVRILEALDFIKKTAAGRPFVVNMSLGRHAGDHKGLSLVEQGMDALLAEAPGRAITLSAGNYYMADAHVSGRIEPGRSRAFTWETSRADRTPNELEIWYAGRDALRVTIAPPHGGPPVACGLGRNKPIVMDGRPVGHMYHRAADPNTGDHHIDIFLQPEAPAGDWRITLQGETVVDGRFDAWVERDAACSGCQSAFASEEADPAGTVGTICNGFLTVAVGAYDAHDPMRPVAEPSSSGPTRDGRQKPDLAAPGRSVLAARSAPRRPAGDAALLTRKTGTSMAAPHVAGCIALMFETAGTSLPIHATRRLLLSSAESVPADPGSALRIGAGYLNIPDAVAAAAQYRPREDPQGARAHLFDFNPKGNHAMETGKQEKARRPEAARSKGPTFSHDAEPDPSFTDQGREKAGDLPAAGNPAETSSGSAARLEWINLEKAVGSDGKEHLFYATSGAKGPQRAARFDLRITNTNTAYNLKNAEIEWRLRTRNAEGDIEVIPVNNANHGGEPGNPVWRRESSPGVADEESIVRHLLVRPSDLAKAYRPDAAHPMTWLDVRYYWDEGVSWGPPEFYTQTSLAFYLVEPVEILWSRARFIEEIRLNNRKHDFAHWVFLYERTFRSRKEPADQVSASVTTSVSRGAATSLEASQSKTVVNGREISFEVGQEQGGSASIGLDKIVEIGLSASRSSKAGLKLTHSEASEVGRRLTRSQSFAQTLSKTLGVQGHLSPLKPGRVHKLYAYPVYRLYQVPVVLFTGINDRGQATQRRQVDNFPIMRLVGWGTEVAFEASPNIRRRRKRPKPPPPVCPQQESPAEAFGDLYAGRAVQEAVQTLWGCENSHLATPALVFDTFTRTQPSPLQERLSQTFELVAGPGRIPEDEPVPGDLVITRSLGEGSLATVQRMGVFGETLPPRLLDATGRVARNVMVLRPRQDDAPEVGSGDAMEGMPEESDDSQRFSADQTAPVRARILWPALGFPAVIAPRNPPSDHPMTKGDATRCICVLLLSDRKFLSKEEAARHLRYVPWKERGRRHIPEGEAGTFSAHDLAVRNDANPPRLILPGPKDALAQLIAFGGDADGRNGITVSLAHYVRNFYTRQGLAYLHEIRVSEEASTRLKGDRYHLFWNNRSAEEKAPSDEMDLLLRRFARPRRRHLAKIWKKHSAFLVDEYAFEYGALHLPYFARHAGQRPRAEILHPLFVQRPAKRALTIGHLTDLHVSVRADAYDRNLQRAGSQARYNNWNQSFANLYERAGGTSDVLFLTGDLIDYGRGHWGQTDTHRLGVDNFYHVDRNWFLFYYLIASEDVYRKPVYTILGNHDWRLNPYPPIAVAGAPGPELLIHNYLRFTPDQRKAILRKAHGPGHDPKFSYYAPAESKLELLQQKPGDTLKALARLVAQRSTMDVPHTPTHTTVESVAWYLLSINPFLDYAFALPGGHKALMLDWAEDEDLLFPIIVDGKEWPYMIWQAASASSPGPKTRNALTKLQKQLTEIFLAEPGKAKIIGVHAPPIGPYPDWSDDDLFQGRKTYRKKRGARGPTNFATRKPDGSVVKWNGHPLLALRHKSDPYGMAASYGSLGKRRDWLIQSLADPQAGVRLVLSGHIHRNNLFVVHKGSFRSGGYFDRSGFFTPATQNERLFIRGVAPAAVRKARPPAVTLTPEGHSGPLYVNTTSAGPRGNTYPIAKRHVYVDPGYTRIKLAGDGTIHDVSFPTLTPSRSTRALYCA